MRNFCPREGHGLGSGGGCGNRRHHRHLGEQGGRLDSGGSRKVGGVDKCEVYFEGRNEEELLMDWTKGIGAKKPSGRRLGFRLKQMSR